MGPLLNAKESLRIGATGAMLLTTRFSASLLTWRGVSGSSKAMVSKATADCKRIDKPSCVPSSEQSLEAVKVEFHITQT